MMRLTDLIVCGARSAPTSSTSLPVKLVADEALPAFGDLRISICPLVAGAKKADADERLMAFVRVGLLVDGSPGQSRIILQLVIQPLDMSLQIGTGNASRFLILRTGAAPHSLRHRAHFQLDLSWMTLAFPSVPVRTKSMNPREMFRPVSWTLI